MLGLSPPSARRRPSLTPMIDVVFLLLIFFMVSARFGGTAALPLPVLGASGAAYSGPPRLVTVLPEAVLVNGVVVADPISALRPLMAADSDVVVIRAGDGADVARLAQVLTELRAGGLRQLAVVE